MKPWQKFVSDHHEIEVLNDNQIKVFNIGYDLQTNVTYYDIVTKEESSYFTETFQESDNKRIETAAFNTIKEYLGY